MAGHGQTDTQKQLEHLGQTLSTFTDGQIDNQAALSAKLKELFHPVRYSKKQNLQEPGAVATRLFYLYKGVVRFYFTKPDGKQANKSFACEGTLFAGHRSNDSEPIGSWYGIQALEDCQVLVASLEQFHSLAERDKEVGLLVGAYYRWLAAKKERRERMLLSLDAAGRYNEFLKEYPGLAGRIAQYHIAAYIGVTDVTLSRLRNPSI